MPITMMVIKTFNFGNCKEVFQPATTYMFVIKSSLAVLAVVHKKAFVLLNVIHLQRVTRLTSLNVSGQTIPMKLAKATTAKIQ